MKYISLLTLFLIYSESNAQGFTKILNGKDFPYAVDIKYIQNRIFVSGIELDQPTLRQGMGFYLLDTFGNILKKNTSFRDEDKSKRYNSVGSRMKMMGNKIFVIYDDLGSTGLIEIDTSLQYKIYPSFQDPYTSINLYDMEIYDHKYYLVGNTLNRDGTGVDMLTVCLDSTGKYLWNKRYEIPVFFEEGTRIFHKSNGVFELWGVKALMESTGNLCPLNIKAIVRNIDTAGHSLNYWELNSDLFEQGFFQKLQLSNSDYIYTSNSIIKFPNPNECIYYTNPFVAIRNKNNILKKRRFLQSEYEDQLRLSNVQLNKSYDGNFIITGNVMANTSFGIRPHILIEKIDSNANRIWKRLDTLVAFGSGGIPVVRAAEILPSGSIVIAGNLENYIHGFFGFVYKVNPDGCVDWSHCGSFVTSSTEPSEEIKTTTFPNPTSSSITISIEGLYKNGMEYEVYDMTGRKVKIKVASPFGTEMEVHDLPSGMYNYVLKLDGRVMGSGGFVRE
jgi:hypothetical protein